MCKHAISAKKIDKIVAGFHWFILYILHTEFRLCYKRFNLWNNNVKKFTYHKYGATSVNIIW